MMKEKCRLFAPFFAPSFFLRSVNHFTQTDLIVTRSQPISFCFSNKEIYIINNLHGTALSEARLRVTDFSVLPKLIAQTTYTLF